MPVAVSYPGVYIQELPSGVHPITGVATSITAFAGWTNQGPTAPNTLVLSWSDYQRTYGGLLAGNPWATRFTSSLRMAAAKPTSFA